MQGAEGSSLGWALESTMMTGQCQAGSAVGPAWGLWAH